MHLSADQSISRYVIPGFQNLAGQQNESSQFIEDQNMGSIEGASSEQQLAELRQRVQDEAQAQGRQEGIAQAQKEWETRLSLAQEILAEIQHPMNIIDEKTQEHLVGLAVAIAKQIIRRELSTSSEQIVAVVKEALAQVSVGNTNLQLHLHPHDIEHVKAMFNTSDGNQQIELIEDPSITSGGCKILSEYTGVDASLESQVAQIATQLMGDMRKTQK